MLRHAAKPRFFLLRISIRGRHWGSRYCGVGQFILRYFSNFNLELRCSPNLRDAVFQHFGRYKNCPPVLRIFPSLFQFPIVSVLLVISQHATGCSLFCLFFLNRTLPDLIFRFLIAFSVLFALNVICRVVVSVNNIEFRHGIVVLRYLTIFFSILRYLANFFGGIAVFRPPPPHCPPPPIYLLHM